jgi:Rrf2 family protein
MKFSAQEEYGLRCLLAIAREPAGFLTIHELADREALSDAHIGKIMRLLRKGGLVRSTRGTKGGYRLAVSPEQIPVSSVLNALSGRLFSTEFCDRYAGPDGVCVHNTDCSIRSLWAALDAAVDRALRKIVLKDLLCGEAEMTARLSFNLDITPGRTLQPAPTGARPASRTPVAACS